MNEDKYIEPQGHFQERGGIKNHTKVYSLAY